MPNATRLRWLAGLAVGALCASYVLATALGSKLNHNEQMYVAAARLWWDLRLYADYAYLQAPLLPMVNGVLFALAGNDQLLAIARLHVALWGLVAVAGVYALARSWSGDRSGVGLAAALALASHPLFLKNAAESSNYMLPLALAVVSVWALSREGRWAAALSGLAIGLAISCKTFYAVLALGLLAAPGFFRSRERPAAWCAGALVGGLPLLYYALRDLEAFYFGNLGYHVANAEYRRVTRSGMAMTLPAKLRYFRSLWRDPSLIALTAYAAAGAVLAFRDPGARRLLAFAGFSFALACGAALLPTPSFVQYFAMPCVFLVIAGVATAARGGKWWGRAFVAICLVATAFSPATHRLPASLGAESVPQRVDREAEKLREALDCSRATMVATLSPILPLEAGCGIYPEFASGPFGFRVADRHTAEVQERLRIVGAERLASFLDAQQPAAIFVGFERTRDPFFERYARARGYVELPTRFLGRGRVWLSSAHRRATRWPGAERRAGLNPNAHSAAAGCTTTRAARGGVCAP